MKRRTLLQLLGMLPPASFAGMLPGSKDHAFSPKSYPFGKEIRQPPPRSGTTIPAAPTSNLSTGLVDVDGLTGGIRPGEVWLIAGQHCMGKTALGLHIARHVNSQQSAPVLFTTVNKTYEEILQIFEGAHEVPIHPDRYRKTSDFYNGQNADVASFFIEDSITLTAIDVVRNVDRLYEGSGYRSLCQLVVVDDLTNVVENSGITDPEQGACLAYELSYITKSFGIPLIVLATTRFDPFKRKNPRPRISDLKFLGPLARMADKILLLCRDEIYQTTDECLFPGTVEVSLVRNRGGRCAQTRIDINGASLSDCDIPALFEHACA